MSQLRSFIASIFGRRPPTLAVAPARRSVSRPQETVNDAQAYGVAIVPATVTPGGWYWQAVRVHHLTPEENGGNHHVYLDILDPTLAAEANLQGQRAFGARAKISWDGGEQLVTVDKPLNEPGANFPMWKWQTCTVEALGLPGQELPSERVTGLQTGHPDEASGNTLFHHSFSITFVKVQADAVIYRDSAVHGAVRGAAGGAVALLLGSATVARQSLAADGTYRFTDLTAGEYVVAVEGTSHRSAPATVDGRSQARLDLVVPAEGKPLAHYVLFGPAGHPKTKAALLLAQDYLLAFGPAFGFSPAEAAGAGMATIIGGTDAVSAEVEAGLTAGGAVVQRIAGPPVEVAAALAQRIAAGQP
jgi:hypothetical protein